MKDYNCVTFGKGKTIAVLLKGGVLTALISYLFFDQFLFGIVLLPLFIFVWKREKAKQREKQKMDLLLDFREVIANVLAALQTGYSIENSFREAENDFKLLKKENNSDMLKELQYINYQITCNQRLGELLQDFSKRSHLEDVENFVEVFLMARQTGGNMTEILQRTVSSITEKIDVEREIDTLITGKRLEARIMSIIPAGIIVYFRLFSGEFLAPLYHNLQGNVIMFSILVLYGLGIYCAERITDIRV